MQSISHVWLAIFIKSCMGSCWYLKLFVWKFSLIEEWRLQLNVISHIDTFFMRANWQSPDFFVFTRRAKILREEF